MSTKFSVKGFAFATLALLLPMISSAQCAMCRAALESSGDTSQAQAVNDGIVYLMVIPYLLVGVVGYVVIKSRQKARKES